MTNSQCRDLLWILAANLTGQLVNQPCQEFLVVETDFGIGISGRRYRHEACQTSSIVQESGFRIRTCGNSSS